MEILTEKQKEHRKSIYCTAGWLFAVVGWQSENGSSPFNGTKTSLFTGSTNGALPSSK
jgi:hypothetical protein